MRPVLIELPVSAIVVLSSLFAIWCCWSAWLTRRSGPAEGASGPSISATVLVGLGQLVGVSVMVATGRLTSLPIFSYGTCLTLGFGTGIAFAAWLGRRRGLDPNVLLDLGLLAMVSAILGSRIFYYVLEYDTHFAHRSWKAFFFIWEGGLSIIGGVVGALITCTLYVRVRRLAGLAYADAAAVVIPLGEMFGRIGCYMNGCCWGAPVAEDGFVATTLGGLCRFPPGSPAFRQHSEELGLITADALSSFPVHPSQLYTSMTAITLFSILLCVHRFKRREGIVMGTFCVLFPIGRICIEFFRGDSLVRGEGGQLVRSGAELMGAHLSVFQATMMVLLVLGVGVFCWIRKMNVPARKLVTEEVGTP